MDISGTYTAFEGNQMLFQGDLAKVVLKIKRKLGKSDQGSVLIFSDETGKPIDFNFQGTEKDVLKRLEVFVSPDEASKENQGPGRPKLGVISREVSLLPRHWEWLATQSGGASATLRKLVEEARKKSASGNHAKRAQECAHRFMSAMAGDMKGYEEALRALYKRDRRAFLALIEAWPHDVRVHAAALAEPSFGE
jgi:hypothetical protein